MPVRTNPAPLAGLLTAAVALGVTATLAGPAASGTVDPLDRMNVWEGRWNEVVETKESPIAHARSTKSHTTCGWSADHGFMVCEYLSEASDAADHLSIFTYNAAARTYKHLGISKDYKTLEETPVVIEADSWHYTYTLPGRDGQALDMRDSYQFVTPQKRLTRIEASTDGGRHWTLVSQSVAVKVA